MNRLNLVRAHQLWVHFVLFFVFYSDVIMQWIVENFLIYIQVYCWIVCFQLANRSEQEKDMRLSCDLNFHRVYQS